jgi:hypothetical protein
VVGKDTIIQGESNMALTKMSLGLNIYRTKGWRAKCSITIASTLKTEAHHCRSGDMRTRLFIFEKLFGQGKSLVLERVRHPKKYFVQYIFNYSVLFLASIS